MNTNVNLHTHTHTHTGTSAKSEGWLEKLWWPLQQILKVESKGDVPLSTMVYHRSIQEHQRRMTWNAFLALSVILLESTSLTKMSNMLGGNAVSSLQRGWILTFLTSITLPVMTDFLKECVLSLTRNKHQSRILAINVHEGMSVLPALAGVLPCQRQVLDQFEWLSIMYLLRSPTTFCTISTEYQAFLF